MMAGPGRVPAHAHIPIRVRRRVFVLPELARF